jgi:AraC family transcriptional regulator
VARAISYIESHLKDDFTLNEVADAACYSLYHFHRIFSATVGDSARDYIRKRRLTEAGRELVETSRSILAVAMDYGYESQEAFSRAFRNSYDLTPGYFRKQALFYPLREKMSLDYLTFEYRRRREGMLPRIINKGEMLVTGKKITVKADGSNFKKIPLFWSEWIKKGYEQMIPSKRNQEACLGICVASQSDVFDYIIGCEVLPGAEIPKGFISHTIAGADYAVFKVKGPLPESVQKTWNYIYGTWLPEAQYQHTRSDEFELYYGDNGQLAVDIYIPVKKA